MSTLKSINVQHPSSATINIVNDASGNVTVGNNLAVTGTSTLTGNVTAAGTVAMASSFKRNRIINGNMLIDQRNAGAAQINVSSGAFICDRFSFSTSQNSKWSLQQLSISDLAGFTKAAYVTISTTYTTGAADFALVDAKIEGLNVADLGWGTASAKTVTLSFWVKTNLAGTYGVAILNGGGTRCYQTTYTVSASATWQQVTITIAGDTTGTWATDNTTGIWLRWGLGSGSNYAMGTLNTWGASVGYQPSGGIVISGNAGGYWEMTGVQLEVGTKATPYEMQIYSDQLAQCQRYYTKSYDVGTAPGTQVFNGEFLMQTFANNNLYCAVRYPVTMRADPTLTFYPGYGAGASPTAGNFWNYATSANVASAVGRAGSTGYSIEKNTGSASATIGWQYTASAEL